MSGQQSTVQEFARLLCLAYVRRREIRLQQAVLDDLMNEGSDLVTDASKAELDHEWRVLALLVVERKMISHRLRTVFDV